MQEEDYVRISGSIIPLPTLRWCGPKFKDNDFYLRSTEVEANRLLTRLGYKSGYRILDIGCGQGRLPIGILRVIGEINYLGLDIDKLSIDWCKKNIEQQHPSFRFNLINVYNERYNTNGQKLTQEFQFGLSSSSIDIIYLYSVFTHTTEEDMRIYLNEFSRILDSEGMVFFTAFIEDNVPNISINPDKYIFTEYIGPLHVVRYNKSYLFSILDQLGYSVESYEHRIEVNNQSSIYLKRKSK